jgi:glutathione S-transferase
MLKFYYNPLSPIARRVWLALLEKQISFEPVLVNLDGDQFQSEFLVLNPFHHVPVIVDDGFRIIESLAILDYLEVKYPTPPLLPTDAQTLAKVRMVQMVALNELAPPVIPLLVDSEDSPQQVPRRQAIEQVLSFFSDILEDSLYFGGDQFTLGDLVAGNSVILLTHLGINLAAYPNLEQWCERLMARAAWQQVQPGPEDFAAFRQRAKALMRLRRQQFSQAKP